jgi:mono/diheme cytochrome c family protein
MPKFNLSEEEAKIAADYIKGNFVSKDISDGLFTETTIDEGKAEAGKTFFYDYGCNACHAVGAVGGVIGPNLDSSGDRLEPNYIYAHLKNPRHADPADFDSVEPDYKLAEEEIINLVHFLMSLTKKGTS